MRKKQTTERQEVYQVKVNGKLDESWSDWLNGFSITFEDDTTIITGPVVDQVALRSLLERIWDLNLEVISLSRIDKGIEDAAG